MAQEAHRGRYSSLYRTHCVPWVMTCSLADNFLLMCVFLYIMYIRVYIVYLTAQGVYRRRYSSLYLIHYASWVTTT